MSIQPYLAMTAAEKQAAAVMPTHMAWMACHFSCYSTGLSNLPDSLPPDSMIILNDRTPIAGHDPERILQQLRELSETLQPAAFLLDFQRSHNHQASFLAQLLTQELTCPVGVSHLYARELNCPVFLPIPLRVGLQEAIAPWAGREIWLEATLDAEQIFMDSAGTRFIPSLPDKDFIPAFTDERLHCGYTAEAKDGKVTFSLQRGHPDLESLLSQAENFGITTAVGLYQQLGQKE